MSLRKRTVSGILWTFSQQFTVQLITFIVQITLARILSPREFGLIAMLSVFMGIGNSLMDSGLTSSLIRTPNADQKDYSTVFFINVVGSIVVYFALFFAAPLIAAFYSQAILIDIIRIYSLSLIIKAFVGVQTTILTKAMNFKLQMVMQIPSVVIGAVVGIILAFKGYGVWSLVWYDLTQSFLFTIQHWIHSKWYPKFLFDKERLKHHFLFGYKLTLSGLLNIGFNNIYTLVIGKYFSAAQLGYYNRADTIRMMPVQSISTALNKVTYPMFASIHQDDERLKIAYKKLMQQIFFWIAAIMTLLIIICEPLFRILLTEKWLPAVPYFQILCFPAILYPLQVYNLNILNVKGRSDLFLKLEIIKKIVIVAGVLSALPFGIYGLLYIQILIAIVSFYINTYYSGRLIGYTVKDQLIDIFPIFILAISIGLFVFALDHFYYKWVNDLGRIFLCSFSYFSAYLVISYLIKMSPLTDFKMLFLKNDSGN